MWNCEKEQRKEREKEGGREREIINNLIKDPTKPAVNTEPMN